MLPLSQQAPGRALPFALALVLTMGTASRVRADTDMTPLALHVTEPAPVTLDETALGRATHSLRVVLTNTGTQTMRVEPLALRFRPVRDGVAFSCDKPDSLGDPPWPRTLDAGASVTLVRDVACETPLPGRYEVEVRGRPRDGPDSAERSYGSFFMQIEPGANPPVRLPWRPSLHAAALPTKDMRPSKDPNHARVVVALINGTRAPAPLSPVHATMRVARHGSHVAVCAEHGVDLAFTGSLGAGRSQLLSAPLGCALSAEADYDVHVSLADASGAKVHLGTYAIRVAIIPSIPPRLEPLEPGMSIDGM
jgi:hypothetical protein